MPYSQYTHRKRLVLIVGPYMLVVLVSFIGALRLEAQDHQACLERRDVVEVVRKVVDIATTPSGGPVDLSKIAGFDQLDPTTQIYLRNLSEQLTRANPSGEPSLHDRLLLLIPIIQC